MNSSEGQETERCRPLQWAAARSACPSAGKKYNMSLFQNFSFGKASTN